eukprot:797123-Amphidinium_carterae.1
MGASLCSLPNPHDKLVSKSELAAMLKNEDPACALAKPQRASIARTRSCPKVSCKIVRRKKRCCFEQPSFETACGLHRL